jgi:hypothetical protein
MNGYHGTASLGETAGSDSVDEIEQRHHGFMIRGVTACFRRRARR